MSNNLAISRQKTGTKKESECRFSFSSGSFIADFNTEIYASDVKSAEVLYSRLYQINKNSSNGINIKLGGMINVIGNLRINPGLQNNTLGFEVVPTGFGSVKIQKDLSRLTQKEGRFLFFNYLLSPRQKSLSCRINLGLINAAYRNGYVYTVQGDAINKPNPFSGHSLSLFSGFRLNTAIDYYIGLGNSNAIQLSYLWDGYSTGGDFEPFQMVSNTFRFTFLFSTNNQ